MALDGRALGVLLLIVAVGVESEVSSCGADPAKQVCACVRARARA